MRLIVFFFLLPINLIAQPFSSKEIRSWENQAKRINIIRDNWGIPHIYGKTDADAVFGLLYAQCEDDFSRVEANYIEKLGRLSEVNGKDDLYNDLLIRLVIDSAEAIKDYQRAPVWLKNLCNAFADGINYYLYKNPSVKPALLQRFQPWYPMLWTDGSIGAISTADIRMSELKEFYSGQSSLTNTTSFIEPLPTGSNGFAIGPAISASKNAILYINPHVSFYFRPEVHMVSEEGLNAYGAVTWGQFFIYQGFNEKCGWMHTSSYVDAGDSYIEKIEIQNNKWYYRYDGKKLPVRQKPIRLSYKTSGGIITTTIQAKFTHHGPLMAVRNGEFLSMKADNRLLNGLIQCWKRTKAKGLKEFESTLALKGNISNNTVYADADGNIGYWHGNRIPKRDTAFNWTKPVDGSTKASEWQGLHEINQTLHVINPRNGWLQNCNSTPFRVAGDDSPTPGNFPVYMAPDGENFRGINAVRVLSEEKKFTLDKIITAGYDTRLSAFEVLVPAVVKAFEHTIQPNDTLFAWLAGPIAVLKNWDYKSNEASIATTLAVEWGQKLLPIILQTKIVEDEELDQVEKTSHFVASAKPLELLQPLLQTVLDLQARFGKWQLPWGEINRFQRLTGSLQPYYKDDKPSLPVGFASGTWGMLPSYTSRTFPGTNKRYGVHGNSFVCAVEFGTKVKAKALLAGGQSGDPASKHFKDQATLYSTGTFRDVLFYKEDVLKAVERQYHPGE